MQTSFWSDEGLSSGKGLRNVAEDLITEIYRISTIFFVADTMWTVLRWHLGIPNNRPSHSKAFFAMLEYKFPFTAVSSRIEFARANERAFGERLINPFWPAWTGSCLAELSSFNYIMTCFAKNRFTFDDCQAYGDEQTLEIIRLVGSGKFLL